MWNIEGPAWLEEKLPFKAAGLNCPVVPDVTPYKKRKVRILNGAHSGFVLGAYLAGFNIVRECMENPTVLGFMNKMLYDEVIPTLPLDKKDLTDFAAAVQDRFNNPFVNHELMSISLNSTSKWRARDLPSFEEYAALKGELPKCLTASFAAYIAFYSCDIQALTDAGLVCRRPAGNEYTIRHGEVVYDNPSPGNKQGGITTLEDKSCGCVQKGGSAPIVDVIGYAEPVTKKGLNMLYGPGNDLVSATALTAAGAHMILFTTGRGTPFGAPAPTMKIATTPPSPPRKPIGSTSTPAAWPTACSPWTRRGPSCWRR